MEAANAIITDLNKAIVGALVDFIGKRGVVVSSYRYYEDCMGENPMEISDSGFIIGANGNGQYIFINTDNPPNKKCKTLLHELIHAMTCNYITDEKRDIETPTREAPHYLYQQSFLSKIFCLYDNANERDNLPTAV